MTEALPLPAVDAADIRETSGTSTWEVVRWPSSSAALGR